MTFSEVRRQVVEAVQDASGTLNDPRHVRALTDEGFDVPFEDLELDSLSTMDVCVEIENRTGIEVELGELVQHPSINRLAHALVEKQAGM